MAAQPVVADAQRAIERRATDIRTRVLAGSLAPGDATGDFEDWVLDLDGYRLLLHPPTGQWLGYDRVHNTWEPTGIGSGEATFTIIDGRLAADRSGPIAVPTAAPAQASAPVTARRRRRRRPVRTRWRILSRLSLVIGLISTGLGIFQLVTHEHGTSPTGPTAASPVAVSSVACAGDGWALKSPAGWTDAGAGGPCRTFTPGPESDVTLPDAVAIHARPLDGDDQYRLEKLRAGHDIIESAQKTVGGFPALRIVYPDDRPGTADTVEYVIYRPDSVFSLQAVGVYPFDLDTVGATLDAMAESLRF
ncbi:hypothetical protein [Pengzhenrongella sp.]|uniref:hypothetical protein n=1 Tax=Pengzhenrongella sp. TaxID=2888820 RepID=UPI002F957B1F